MVVNGALSAWVASLTDVFGHPRFLGDGVCEVFVALVEGERREEGSSVSVGAAIIGDEGPELDDAMELVKDER